MNVLQSQFLDISVKERQIGRRWGGREEGWGKYRVPTFPDWQNSLTFPVFFAIFPVLFYCFVFLTENLVHFTKKCTVHLNITKISNNIYLNLSQFSSILCGFPWLFQSVQNSLTFPWLENAFPFFQVFQVFQSEWEPWSRDEVEVCDSVTHNVQFDVNCQMIS